MGYQRREPYLKTLDATASNPNGALGQANSDTSLSYASVPILYDEAVAKVYAQCDRWVGNGLQVDRA